MNQHAELILLSGLLFAGLKMTLTRECLIASTTLKRLECSEVEDSPFATRRRYYASPLG